ncbi:NAD(P)/FAD-dependent oxidoreductase [Chitinibacteraceae bacterium HSL-7]
MTNKPLVVVGSGLAAINFAREWRKRDAERALVIVTRDGGDFYSKPMLSNALAGNKSPEALVMKKAAVLAEELKADLRVRTEVVAIDVNARQVTLADDTVLEYGDLVLACGADPVRLDLAGQAERVLSVNDLDDYARFVAALEGQKQVVIIGAGLIGCEFANDLRAREMDVTVVDPASWPLSRLVPQQAGDAMRAGLEAAGVSFELGRSVVAVSADAVTLDDGRELPAGVVLSAVGLRARTALAQAAGLSVARGVVVDRQLRSSNAHVYALGDCAEVAGLSLPFVMPIMQQARTLAAVLAGDDVQLSYPAMPVVVKTPAHPTVVSPAEGAWVVEPTEAGLIARCVQDDGGLAGVVLMGDAVKQRQQFVPQLRPWLG